MMRALLLGPAAATTLVLAALTLGPVSAGAAAAAQRGAQVVAAPSATAAQAFSVSSTDPAAWAFEAPALGSQDAGTPVTLPLRGRDTRELSADGSVRLECSARGGGATVPDRAQIPVGKLPGAASTQYVGSHFNLRSDTPEPGAVYTLTLPDCGYGLAGPVYPIGADAQTFLAPISGSPTGTVRGSTGGFITVTGIANDPVAPGQGVTFAVWALTTEGTQVAYLVTLQFKALGRLV